MVRETKSANTVVSAQHDDDNLYLNFFSYFSVAVSAIVETEFIRLIMTG